MSVMIDMIGASVMVGIMMVSILKLNANLTAETYRSVSSVSIQTEAIQLSRIAEFDFYKAGYGIAKPGVITLAESSHIIFKANLKNIVGGSDVIEYLLGGSVGTSTNPNDKQLSRYENSTRVFVSNSVTRFRLQYFDARDSMLVPPLASAQRDSVRSIKVLLNMESPEPFSSAYHTDSTYAGAYYEKLIFPRNLQ